MTDAQFSIIITFYNQRDFVKDALDSALSLRNQNKEIIVVDDGSTDGTQDVTQSYRDKVRLVRVETNQGAGAARNCGAALATGEYLVFLDGDDALPFWALDVFQCIIELKKPKMMIGHMRWFEGVLPTVHREDTPREIRVFEFEDYLRRDRPFTHATIRVVHRQSFQSAEGWSTDIWPANDIDFLLRLCTAGRTILIQSPPTAFRRSHANNTFKVVAPYISSFCKIIQNERLGKYPGGSRRSFERQAVIGGLSLIWVKRAAGSGLWRDALKLLVRCWRMGLAAVALRLWVIIKGRRPYQTIGM